MPTITYQRIWCKKCNDFTLHSYSQGEAECKTCDAIYTEVWLSEIPKEKIIEQRQRYKARKIKRFGNMFGAYLNPIEASLFTEFKKADIIESDAGQKGIDEERNKKISIMCDSIRFQKEKDVMSVRQFQERFKVDAKLYGWDGNEEFIDCCMCEIDLNKFFKEHPEHEFHYDLGEWWEGKKTDV